MIMDDIAKELLREVEKIDAALNRRGLAWYELRKAMNILKGQKKRFYPYVAEKLFHDIRGMYIEQLPLERLYPHMDRALSLAVYLNRRFAALMQEELEQQNQQLLQSQALTAEQSEILSNDQILEPLVNESITQEAPSLDQQETASLNMSDAHFEILEREGFSDVTSENKETNKKLEVAC